MSVRDDIAEQIRSALYDVAAGCPGISVGDSELAADAVLDYLGGLDDSADGELVAWHLRNDRLLIGELRAQIDGWARGRSDDGWARGRSDG